MNQINGVHHLAISTADMKAQIEFFSQILGMELVALYWMHGAEKAWHAFMRLNDYGAIAFVARPDIKDIDIEIGRSHAGHPGAPSAPGTMQHLAFRVDNHDELLAFRDRIRSHGVPVMGPIDHGFCCSIYFSGLEDLTLEISYSRAPIEADAWIDPEVVALAGIDAEELQSYKKPPAWQPAEKTVAQPDLNGAGPHMRGFAPGAYEKVMGLPDSVIWEKFSDTEPPNAAMT